MKKLFVPYELALKLKELDFDEPCFGVYINGRFYPRYKSINSKFKPNQKLDKSNVQYCTAPTWQQAENFLLKKYNLYGIIIPTITMHWTFKTMTVVEDIVEVPPYNHVDGNDYSTIGEAGQACLEKLIEICEKN